MPWVERLRFVSSGTEAVMSALRVARAATGRSHVLKFEGCYHGHADGLLVQAGSGLAGASAASSAGIPHGTLAHTLVAPLDDEAAIDAVFDAAGHDLAAVIVEPVPANYGLLPQRQRVARPSGRALPRRRRAARRSTKSSRASAAGSTARPARFGLAPDLSATARSSAAGFRSAAYGGRADLMDLVAPVGPVYQAGTLSANPVGMRAGLATLERDGRARRLARARSAHGRVRRRASRAGFARVAPGLDDRPRTRRSSGSIAAPTAPIRRPDRIPADQAAWYARFFHAALARGVYLPPSAYEVCFLSLAHDEATLARGRRRARRRGGRGRTAMSALPTARSGCTT